MAWVLSTKRLNYIDDWIYSMENEAFQGVDLGGRVSFVACGHQR